MGKRVAYQGIAGSFSSMAARALYGSAITPIQTTRFREIFEHVVSGSADVGVVPLENALAGSVHENYDLLQEFECYIVGEYYCPVHLHVLGSGPIEKVRRVFSHPKALEQCSIFLERHPEITAVVCSDTAAAALQVRDSQDPSQAALASEEAAATYHLPILARSIQNHQDNSTRFVSISAQPSQCETPTKSSIVVSLPHEPGSLYKLLGEIASLSLNLTKIESRPILGRPFEYAFHIDIECPIEQTSHLREASARLARYASVFRELGLYQAKSPLTP